MSDLQFITETEFSLIYLIEENDQKRVLKKYKSLQAEDARREFLYLKTMDHPGIVKALQYGFDEYPFLITEYVEGQALTAHLLKGRDSEKIIAELSDVLAYIHSCGLCVNDIKPENIIIRNNQPVIIDFGLASVNLFNQYQFKGTLAYSSPEKIFHNTAHFASDVFSLGMLAFYLINHKTIIDVFGQDDYLNILKSKDKWNETLKSLIKDRSIIDMLAYDPNQRPSALNLAKDYFNRNIILSKDLNETLIKSFLFKSQNLTVQKLWKKRFLNYNFTDEPQKIENLLALHSESEGKKLIILDEKLFITNPDEFYKAFPIGYRDKERYHHKLIEWLSSQNANILLKRSESHKSCSLFEEVVRNFEVFVMNEQEQSELKNVPAAEIQELIDLLYLENDIKDTIKNQIKTAKPFHTRVILLRLIFGKYQRDEYNELSAFLQWIDMPLPISLIEILWENWYTLIQNAILTQSLIVDGDMVKSDKSLRTHDSFDKDSLAVIIQKLKNTQYHFILGRLYFLTGEKTQALLAWTSYLDYLIKQQYFISAYEFIAEIRNLFNDEEIPFEIKKKDAFISRIVGNFDESMDKYRVLIEGSTGVMKAVLSCDLAIVLQALKRNDESIEIYKSAIDLFKLHKDWKSLFRAMNNLGVVYFGLKKYTDAEILFNDVLQQARLLDNLQFETISYLNLADINCKRGEWKKALFHSEKAVHVAEKNNKWNLVANGLIISAKCYFALGDYEKSVSILENLIIQPQSRENKLILQEIQAWLIHYYSIVSEDKIQEFLSYWEIPSSEMHEILIRELFFTYYSQGMYHQASEMVKKLPEQTLFTAFLDSDFQAIQNRLKELKIQNENDSYLYYLTHLIKTGIVSKNRNLFQDLQDDIQFYDYKPAEFCLNINKKDIEIDLVRRITDLFDQAGEDIFVLIKAIMKEFINLVNYERIIYFENRNNVIEPVYALDKYSREYETKNIIFSSGILKQLLNKQGFVYEKYLINSEELSVHSSMLGLGINSITAYVCFINKEFYGLFYADTGLDNPLNPNQLLLVETLFKLFKTFAEKSFLEKKVQEKTEVTRLSDTESDNWKMIGNSKVMMDMFSKIRMVAGYNVNVLIIGPTGSGKEMVSKAIHQLYIEKNPYSKNAPFIAVNCAAIPEQLLESELFGYKKGAFTGAVNDMRGKILQADHGTIFLDEIGEMPLLLQAKLLRVIQDKEVTPLGSSLPIPVSVRIIAATNKNLEEMVAQNLFRADLYYRLKVVTIQLPSLTERKEDIPLLVMNFLKKYNQKFGKQISGIHPGLMNYLQDKDWKGNIRELENEIERAVLLCNRDYLSLEDVHEQSEINALAEFRHLPLQWQDYKDYKQKIMDELDQKYIKQLLEEANNNVSLASKIGDLERVQIYRLLKK